MKGYTLIDIRTGLYCTSNSHKSTLTEDLAQAVDGSYIDLNYTATNFSSKVKMVSFKELAIEFQGLNRRLS